MRRRTTDGRRDGRTEDDAREERSDGRGREEARTGSRMTRDAMDSYARRAPFVGERGMVVMTRALSSEYETGYKKRDVSFPPASLFRRAALRRTAAGGPPGPPAQPGPRGAHLPEPHHPHQPAAGEAGRGEDQER